MFTIAAADEVCPDAENANVQNALITEKIDGTCCLVELFYGNYYSSLIAFLKPFDF